MNAGTHVADASNRYCIGRSLSHFLTSCTSHISSVSHELSLVLFEFGILNEALVLANTTLLDAAEGEHSQTDTENTTHRGDDGDLGCLGHSVPFLCHCLRSGIAILAIELDSFSFTVIRVSHGCLCTEGIAYVLG